MDINKKRIAITNGETALGIELGSTRIKAALVDKNGFSLASGSYQWENQLENGLWTYSLKAVWQGLQSCFDSLKKEVEMLYGTTLTAVGGITVSAMMHGYLAFDKKGNLLVPFRTWRNTMTEQAAQKLTALLGFNIPQRWSVAHLYQAMLNKESHVKQIDFITTLAGYVHWQLTGQKVIGIGDASGMFPIDSNTLGFDSERLAVFQNHCKDFDVPWQLTELLPKVLLAGERAGVLTEKGAGLLDSQGNLKPSIPFYPPEGDAGTGMVSTNSILPKTGNVSAGTSVFAMVVLEKALKQVHEEIDMVTTPTGKPVAMVHCNNCTSDINAWAQLFMEFTKAIGHDISYNQLYETLFTQGLQGDSDGGAMVAYNYLSGEHTTGFEQGRPLFARSPGSAFTLANFMRTHLYTALATLKIGMKILLEEEKAALDSLLGHGGFFKTEKVGQSMLAAAMNVPVSVMETAGEGGAWGAALLAAFGKWKEEGETLEAYLNRHIFALMKSTKVYPKEEDVIGFNFYIEQFIQGFPIQRAAIENINSIN